MTAFQKGDVVVSSVDAQGLTRGARYAVIDVIETGFSIGTYTTYVVIPVGGSPVPVINGHLLLSPVGKAAAEKIETQSKTVEEAAAKVRATRRALTAGMAAKIAAKGKASAKAKLTGGRDPAALKRYSAKSRIRKALAAKEMTPSEALLAATRQGWDEAPARAWIEEAVGATVPASQVTLAEVIEKKKAIPLAAMTDEQRAEAVAEAKAKREAKAEPTPESIARAAEAAAPKAEPVVVPDDAKIEEGITDEALDGFVRDHPEMKQRDLIKTTKASMNRVKASIERVRKPAPAAEPAPEVKVDPTERASRLAAARAKLAAIAAPKGEAGPPELAKLLTL